MKEKEADVSQLLSKLSLKNNLDQEDEEDEVVESLVVVEQNEEMRINSTTHQKPLLGTTNVTKPGQIHTMYQSKIS